MTAEIYKPPLSERDLLPAAAVERGWRLQAEIVWRYGECIETGRIYLKDRDDNILHTWEHDPSLSEIFEVCERLLKS